ncbi:Golgi apparatus membrane protein TVP38 [Hypsizygus marmoreus]|uniref:Golgi apparatus membrane protein TVP38 n=1 Tax=Hypsizygus marmoreus TaxID=39966 RepID=A0A369JMZ0_HYPMA|nr:Golgi apparatus membrane protein TVP38 [Hypsizygus marmoreus]
MASHYGNGNGYPYPPPAAPPPFLTTNPYTAATLNTSSTTLTPGPNTSTSLVKPENLSRTPSPTPSEARELKTGVLDWKTVRKWRFWFRREWLWYYVALVVILVITALVTLYHKQIVEWLTPVTRWLHDLRFGWLVPIGVLFVISFPPLFGHEIVAILCGLVWGLWIGFGIVSAGTFLGEVGNFYAFKYCCRARGEKLERTKITYACLAKVVRDGGFKIALIARLSAIPGHFTTAVFSTCGMGIFVFSLAAILSMPKQFITVYLGVILEQSSTGVKDTKSRIISDVVLAVTFLITVLAMWYIFRQMNKVKPEVIYARRKARQAKLARADFSPYSTSTSTFAASSQSTVAFDDSDAIPLTSPYPQYQNQNPYQYQNQNQNQHQHPAPIHAPQPQVPSSYSHDVEAAAAYGGMHHVRQSVDEVGWDVSGGGGGGGGAGGSGETVRNARVGYGYGYGYVGRGSDESSGSGSGSGSVETLRGGAGYVGGREREGEGERGYGQSERGYGESGRGYGQSESQREYGKERIPGSVDIGAGGRGEMAQTQTQTPTQAWRPGAEDRDQDQDMRTPRHAQQGHVQEATDATYRTAREPSDDTHTHGQSVIPLQPPQPPRVLSPPPPSYRTNVG